VRYTNRAENDMVNVGQFVREGHDLAGLAPAEGVPSRHDICLYKSGSWQSLIREGTRLGGREID
jgi:hypothetical protein